MKAQKCPICGQGVLKKKTVTETFEYKGNTKTIPGYVTYSCPECGESIVDNNTIKESGRILKNFQREVDGLLTGDEIKAIRRKLDLTQEQLAQIIGGGLKSLARYESGKICQSKGMDNLLRILDAYPDTLKVIRKNNQQSKIISKVIYIEDYRSNSYQSRSTGFCSDQEEAAYGS
ncbi:MAG: type II toxin-antitoxin system MqsA family antitoxin [Syntrophales bacterium]|nr:type II toxin-antitoxin system MqsA family antitoxin [Syntrophales bacterium]